MCRVINGDINKDDKECENKIWSDHRYGDGLSVKQMFINV